MQFYLCADPDQLHYGDEIVGIYESSQKGYNWIHSRVGFGLPGIVDIGPVFPSQFYVIQPQCFCAEKLAILSENLMGYLKYTSRFLLTS